jgi:hypothetical protein
MEYAIEEKPLSVRFLPLLLFLCSLCYSAIKICHHEQPHNSHAESRRRGQVRNERVSVFLSYAQLPSLISENLFDRFLGLLRE